MCRTVKIWVDDLRPVPMGYEGTKSVNETIALIEEIEVEGGKIELLDLDHDLGDYAQYGGDAIKILDYLAERETFYPIAIHTANPVGRFLNQKEIWEWLNSFLLMNFRWILRLKNWKIYYLHGRLKKTLIELI